MVFPACTQAANNKSLRMSRLVSLRPAHKILIGASVMLSLAMGLRREGAFSCRR